MRSSVFVVPFFSLCFSCSALVAQELAESKESFASEIVKVALFDGEQLTGKLYLPKVETIKEVVIFVHGTGPGTYLDRRKIREMDFNYHDLFGEEFNRMGIAYFSYNKRGCELGEEPPMFDTVDRAKFKKVVPSVEVKDLSATIAHLRSDARFESAKIVLLGWSEGTVIASLVAEDKSNHVAALLLAGYANESMFDVIAWQFSGASSMVNLNPAFDEDGDGRISKEEYESDNKRAKATREKVMQNVKFNFLDPNKDGMLTAADFAQRVKMQYDLILRKIAERDDDWIWDYYFHVSTDWLHEHFALEANKTRLLRFDTPIYIFHGEEDAALDVNGVRDLESRFAATGKSNLNAFIFAGHDHDLNFLKWALKNEIPEGIRKIFEVAGELNE